MVILEAGSCKLFAWTGLERDPLDLSLPSNEDYRHESPAPGISSSFLLAVLYSFPWKTQS
jgi:hypothetical protein